MKKYKFILDRIETRSLKEGKRKKYIVRGYASVPNKVDIYKFDGKKGFKSLFTEKAVESMRKQALSKKVFVDPEHEIATSINVDKILKDIQNTTEENGVDIRSGIEEIRSQLRHSELPFAKVTDLKVDEKGLFVETELNPYFREVDDFHRSYFDATWNSMQEGFINGISINFKPKEVAEKLIGNEYVDVIDDVDLFGFSYTGQPALPENNIVEVAVRSMIETRGEEQMKKEEKKEEKGSAEKTDNSAAEEIEKVKKELESIRSENEKLRKEQEKKQEIEKQKAEKEELKKEIVNELNEKKEPEAKGVVSPKETAPETEFAEAKKFREEIKEHLKELTPNFHEWLEKPASQRNAHCMDDFGKLIQLQNEFETVKTLPEETQRLLEKSPEDIVVGKNKQ